MKIIYLTQELDATKEHELISKNVFGFKVRVKYTKESWYPIKEETIYNCTEVHNLYRNDSIAFESNINQTGFTRIIDIIESVNIEIADKLY